jgi:hypothetical protein
METYRRQFLSRTFTTDSQIIEFILKQRKAAMIDIMRHLRCERAYTKLRTNALIRNGVLIKDNNGYINPNMDGLARYLSEFFKRSYGLFELMQTYGKVSNGSKGTLQKG